MTARAGAERWAGRSLEALAILIAATLATALIVIQQRGSGAFTAEFSATNADEASHFVTGLMLADYFAAGLPAPLPFADDFYVHYPKVGLGHWPPLYYLVEAAWFSVLSPSTPAALLVPAGLAALLAVTAGWTINRALGPLPGIAVAAAVLVLPPVREATLVIVLDLPVALLGLLGALTYARYLDRGRTLYSALFGLIAAAAILTKGTGVGLALLPPLVVLLGGRFDLLKKGSFWLPLPMVAIIAGPWTIGTYAMAASGFQYAWGPAFVKLATATYAADLLVVPGGALVALAGAGIVFAAADGWRRRPGAGLWLALAALTMAMLIFQCVVPAGLDARYLIPLLAPVVMLAALGAMRLIGLAISGWRTIAGLVVAMVILLAALPFAGKPLHKGAIGMDEAAQAFLAREAGNPMVLAGSDASGEGALVAAVAQRDRARRAFVLRGSLLLSVSDWNGAGYAPIYADAADLMGGLDGLGVGFVALDTSPVSQALLHNRQLAEAAARFPERFSLVGAYPRADGTGEVRLYALTGNETRMPDIATLSRLTKAAAGR